MKRISVLDYGSVSLVDSMGSDFTPVEAARVSYGDGLKGVEADTKLLKYLYRNGHMTPFEMVEMTWEIVCPLFVRSQWHRHRTASYNEISQRYVSPEKIFGKSIAFYIPDEFRAQDTKNRQGSAGYLEDSSEAIEMLQRVYGLAEETYNKYLEMGIAREQARIVFPEGVYTKFLYKTDMRNFLHFLELRDSEHAQWEIRQYAQAMREIAEQEWPLILGLL
jgi:thymidylate synthase (FAD)